MIERRQYNESFRQQALEKVYTGGSGTVKVVAEDLNMSDGPGGGIANFRKIF